MGKPPVLKLLLDTHIWIWAVNRPEKLSRGLRRHLESPGSELYLSPVSLWEAHHLEKRGRLRFRGGLAQWIEEAFLRVPIQEAPFNFAVAREASRIQLPEPDIGDVFLAATASVFGLRLVTEDAQLLACKWLATLPNS